MNLKSYSLQVDSLRDAFTTTDYLATEFEGPQISVREFIETANDYNRNGKYEYLRLGMRMEILQPGSYSGMGNWWTRMDWGSDGTWAPVL